MLHLPRPRSTTFRIVLATALLAWAAFGFEAMAHPLAMNGRMGNMVPASGQTVSPHCKGVSPIHAASAASTPAPTHPADNGHGCCAFGHCDCASFCGNIAGVPSVVMTWLPLRDPALAPVHAGVLSATTPPRLRPPIV